MYGIWLLIKSYNRYIGVTIDTPELVLKYNQVGYVAVHPY